MARGSETVPNRRRRIERVRIVLVEELALWEFAILARLAARLRAKYRLALYGSKHIRRDCALFSNCSVMNRARLPCKPFCVCGCRRDQHERNQQSRQTAENLSRSHHILSPVM